MTFRETAPEWAAYRAMKKSMAVRKYYSEDARRQAADKFAEIIGEKVRSRAESDGAEYAARRVYFTTDYVQGEMARFRSELIEHGDWKHTFWYCVDLVKQICEEMGAHVFYADWDSDESYMNSSDYGWDGCDDDYAGTIEFEATLPAAAFEGIEQSEDPLASYESPYRSTAESLLNGCPGLENVHVGEGTTDSPGYDGKLVMIWEFDYKGEHYSLDVIDHKNMHVPGYNPSSDVFVSVNFKEHNSEWWTGFKTWDDVPSQSEFMSELDAEAEKVAAKGN